MIAQNLAAAAKCSRRLMIPDLCARGLFDRVRNEALERLAIELRPPMARAFDIEPLDATFGAVVTGVKLAAIDDTTWRDLHAAWLEWL